jgi:hypothetical protein
MALKKVASRKNGTCKPGSRHVKNRSGCFRSPKKR